MKVFLSHSTKDKQFVQALAAQLEAEKIEHWLCEVDIEFGQNFVAKIEEGLRDADLTILFWSPEAARSDWTRLEWTSVTAREISESRTRLGIVLLRDCEVPELLRVKHRIDARTDPEQGRHETIDWIKRLRDMQRLVETTVAGVFLPDPPHDFVGRAETLEMLYAALVEKHDKALLYGEPGCGKSTLALKFACQTQGAFDAVVFQPCGQRPVAEIAVELATKLELGVETRPPEEQIAAAKKWFTRRRALLVLDDIWENDVKALAPGPPASLLCTSRRRSLPWISLTHSLEVKSFSRGEVESIFRVYLGAETVEQHRDALLEFAERMERLPIAIVVGADMLRSELDPIPEAARGLRLERLRNEVHDVPALLRRAIAARPEEQRRLLNAMAVCALEGFWLPLTVEIAGLAEAEGRDARNKLVNASLLRMLDRDRQRFQLHALLRGELRNLAPLGELQAAHVAVLEKQFGDWEVHWRQCRECLPEVVLAVQHLWDTSERNRAVWLSYQGFATGSRIGELEIALRILQQEEALCLERSNKNGLQRTYGHQALILRDWGRLEEAMALHKKQEALCLELDNKDDLQRTYGHQALILKDWGRLEEAMALHKKQEALCLELGNKNSLQISYGRQALILRAWGRLEEAMALHKEQEALCLELDNKEGLQTSHGNQASILRAWGRLEEAMALYIKHEAFCLELGNKDGLQITYGHQAAILQAWGRLEEAFELLKKKEAFCLELGNKDGLQITYGHQAVILQAWGRLEEAMSLHKKQEEICLELGNKDGLQITYGNQALILQAWGRLEEAMALHEKEETLCLELGNKDSLQRTYCNQALILQTWGRLEEAFELLKKQEVLCLELGNQQGLQASYGNQALTLQAWARLEEAFELHKKQEALCLELGNKYGLQASYGNQALILQAWGQLEEALALLKKKEALCLELGNKNGLGYCYCNWGLLAREQRDRKTEREKLSTALDIFTKLNMPRERDAVRAELEKTTGADGGI
jgi:tetratricopeptide (TPR) repeat protein